MSTDIEQSFKKALIKVEEQIEKKGSANTEDVVKLQMWQSMLTIKFEAKKNKKAIHVGSKNNN